MSFRIEEKLSIGNNKIIDFKSFLANKTAKQIYQPRKIQSLYFENLNYEMYNDSLEGLTPRKKIRVRNYPGTEDKNQYLENLFFWKGKSSVNLSKFFLIEVFISTIELASL